MGKDVNTETNQPDNWDELSKAQDELLGQVVEEDKKVEPAPEIKPEPKPEPEPEPEVPEVIEPESKPEPEDKDASERSRLGRKVKAITETMEGYGQTLKSIQDILARIESKKTVAEGQGEEVATSEIGSIVERINAGTATEQDIEELTVNIPNRHHLKQAQAKEVEIQKYNQGYVKYLKNKEVEIDPDWHSAVVKEMESGFNVFRTGQGEVDAEINYLSAEASLLKKQVKKTVKSNPLDKNKGKDIPPLGAPVIETVVTKPYAAIEIEPDAREFGRRMGMTEEEMKISLSKPPPLHLQR